MKKLTTAIARQVIASLAGIVDDRHRDSCLPRVTANANACRAVLLNGNGLRCIRTIHLILNFTNEIEALTNGSHTHIGTLLSGVMPKSGNRSPVVVEVTGLHDVQEICPFCVARCGRCAMKD